MSQIQRTSEELEKLSQTLVNIFERNLRRILNRLEAGSIAAQEQILLIGQLTEVVTTNDFEPINERLQSVFADELKDIRARFQELKLSRPFSYSAFDANAVQGLIEITGDRSLISLRRTGADVQAAVAQRLIAGGSISAQDVLGSTQFEEATPRLKAQVNADLQTSVSNFHGAMIKRKADELGLTFFRYYGPDDKVTRPFCDHVLATPSAESRKKFGGRGESIPVMRTSRVYTRPEIEQMNNGQIADVFISRGGYNCRHRWSPITEDRAGELGYPN